MYRSKPAKLILNMMQETTLDRGDATG